MRWEQAAIRASARRGHGFDGPHKGRTDETLAICRPLALAQAVFAAAIAEKPAARFTRMVKRHPEGDW